MKKHVLKVLFSVALMVTIFAPSAFAEEASPGSSSETSSITTLEQLDKRFNLETVTELEKGVIPLEFDSIEEAAKYLELLENSAQGITSSDSTVTSNQIVQPAAATSKTVTKTGSFKTTTKAKLSATISYVAMDNGMIDVVSVKSNATGDGAWTWSQTSYLNRALDGGRSREISISGVLTQTLSVDGIIKKYPTNETVVVLI